ncbi:unnamed protein product [Phyllotreta striolata]|uniref:Uncharacterized protein n=1 Tax=Phyllotreta striolata TaxID=444603 RepID=A0A9N9TQN3_PHYSR|nr:unnamed protein product [Phyllotreta striolata]
MNSILKTVIFLVSFQSIIFPAYANIAKNELQEVEDRKQLGNYPEVSKVLSATTTLLQTIVGVMFLRSTVADIKAAAGDVFFQMRRMASIQGVVGQIPVFGALLQPIVGIIALILSNIPYLGGMISMILVGPEVVGCNGGGICCS